MPEAATDLVNRIKASGAVTGTDTLSLRQVMWDDGSITQTEAEQLFAINRACATRAADWADFFVEAITHFLVHEVPPIGHVNEANAAWLIDQITRDGGVDTLANLMLLAKLLESAASVPEHLKAFALARIEDVVRIGGGAARAGAPRACWAWWWAAS